jgi:hypothetical protein
MRRTLVLATLVATIGALGVTTSAAYAAPSVKQFCNANWKISETFNSLF